MGDLLQCHKAAMKEVIEALNMLRSREGSTVKDIYFVLDNLHGRVERHVIQHALKSAVSKGLLTFQNRRYKIRKQRKPVGRPSRQKSRAQLARAVSVDTDGSSSYYDIPVRNFECRAKSRRGKSKHKFSRSKSYSFREVKSLLTCDCSSGTSGCTEESNKRDDVRKKQRKAKRHVKRKYPVPRKIKGEKTQELCKQNTEKREVKGLDVESDGTPPEILRSESEKTKEESVRTSTDKLNSENKKSEKTDSKSSVSKNSESTKKQDEKESVKTIVIDSTSTAGKSNQSQTSIDDKQEGKVETDSVNIGTCHEGSEALKHSKRGCRIVKRKEVVHNADDERCDRITRSRTKKEAEKRNRPKSSNSSASNHKRAKRSSKKTVKQEKETTKDDNNSGCSSQNYDHMYSKRFTLDKNIPKL